MSVEWQTDSVELEVDSQVLEVERGVDQAAGWVLTFPVGWGAREDWARGEEDSRTPSPLRPRAEKLLVLDSLWSGLAVPGAAGRSLLALGSPVGAWPMGLAALLIPPLALAALLIPQLVLVALLIPHLVLVALLIPQLVLVAL